MPDTASHSSPQLDNGELRHTLTVHDVGAALVAAQVPRSHRQIIRYCETGLLDAVKVPGPTGAQWYVSPASLPKAIGDLKQWEAQRARQGSTQLDTASSVTPSTPLNNAADMARHGEPQHAVSDLESRENPSPPQVDMVRLSPTQSDMPSEETREKGSATETETARYVEQLEKRIDEKDDVIGLLKGQLVAKDEQISELSTRYRETHSLLGAMQRMFAPLLGQGDPYMPRDGREGVPRVDNPGPPQ